MSTQPSNDSLFGRVEQANIEAAAPLAARMRPRRLDEFIGQRHFLGPDKLLGRMLRADRLSSLLFCGPPGVGKTSLAKVIANQTQAHFIAVNAPSASVKDIREVTRQARDRLGQDRTRSVLFIDEIHRFNRAQQDVLLDDVETGVVVLIGATTENPYFSVNSPLISRSTVFHFEPLSEHDLVELLQLALRDKERGLGGQGIQVDRDALEYLAIAADGDARKVLTALEVAVLSQGAPSESHRPIRLTLDIARESIQHKAVHYDGSGDSHYDLASALQKSMRGSDPDATVYWLARMLAGGEDLRFIARRIAITAAEDVGNADPMATVLAAAAVQVCEFVGMPEAQLSLAQAALYIACAPKSNATAKAIWQAAGDVRNEPIRQVPKHLKDSHYAGAKKEGIGSDYKYPHHFGGGYVPQEYLPGSRKHYYKPTPRGHEKEITAYLHKLEQVMQELRPPMSPPSK